MINDIILPLAFVNALITIISELEDWTEELAMISTFTLDAQHFTVQRMVVADDLYQDELLEHWPKLERWLEIPAPEQVEMSQEVEECVDESAL